MYRIFLKFCLLSLIVGVHLVADSDKELFTSSYLKEKGYSSSWSASPTYHEPTEKGGILIGTNTGLGYVFNLTEQIGKSSAHEILFGYHFKRRYKVAVSYQYQNLPHEMQFVGSSYLNTKFKLGINLQTLAVKLYSAITNPYRFHVFVLTPYFSVGGGLGWMDFQRKVLIRETLFLGDLGVSLGLPFLYATVGCKYCNWSWQESIYSITPYVGMQINF